MAGLVAMAADHNIDGHRACCVKAHDFGSSPQSYAATEKFSLPVISLVNANPSSLRGRYFLA